MRQKTRFFFFLLTLRSNIKIYKIVSQYYECKIRYEKQITDPQDKDCGKLKKVTESYLFDALSYTEAEARMVQEVAQYIKGEYSITNIKKTKIAEIIMKEEDICENWFNVKIRITVPDESKGIERVVPETLLVRAEDIEDCLKRFKEAFKGTISDYVITGISTSPILEYYKAAPLANNG